MFDTETFAAGGFDSPESPEVPSQYEGDQGGHPETVERTESDPNAIFNRQSEQQQQQPGDDPEYDIPNLGRMRQSEIVHGYMRNQDYTRKTQSLSEQLRQAQSWQQERQTYEQSLNEIRAFLQDGGRLRAYLAAMEGQQPAKAQEPELDPDAIVTAKEAQSMFERQTAVKLAEVRKEVQEQIREQQVEAYKQQYGEAVTTKLTQIAQKHPELRQIPGMDMMLREAVRSRKPKTIQEALGLFDQAAQFYANKFDAIAKSRIASQQRTNPVNRGIEPPGGSVPMPKAPSQDDARFSGVKDPNLRDLVMQDLRPNHGQLLMVGIPWPA